MEHERRRLREVIENLFIKGYLPILFDNVHSLDVKVSRVKDDDIPAIASFFMGLPNLMTLNITCNPKSRSFLDEEKLRIQGSDFNKQYQRSQNLLPIHQLKEVQRELRGDKNELGLLKYLLSHAKSLEKMTFFILHMFSEMGLQKLKTVSSTVAVFLLPKKYVQNHPWDDE
ncbi:hypothetical protein F0562_011096 [Nyssa sinensis]|uniref:FBD domain-containing protein n=1 Tax=Nyssa sinensis TaxID=561372 RepID=A0A5J5A0W5_9ASTE|nr:hypothetical protein F0562_011096 [Nyssa sinensis]